MTDPFFSPRRTSPTLLVAIAAAVVLAGVAVAAVVLSGKSGPVELEPAPMTARLAALEFRPPPRPGSGFRPLQSFVPPRSQVQAVDIAGDGTLAFAFESPSRRTEVVVVRGNAIRSYPVGTEAVLALAFDPEGILHIGLQRGSLSRIGKDDRMVQELADVSSGNSVVAFAFDPASPRSAVMIAGGEIFTAMRPFSPDTLSPVAMPRVRARAMAFEDGELVVGGDAGAFFAAADDGWNERPLATSGRIVAMGYDAEGVLIVAQANGHVFRADGARWDRLGQVPQAPIAVGQLSGDRGVTVLAADGSLFARLGRDEFSELPEYEGPAGPPLRAGVIRGANVAYIADGALHVWDGEGAFDSAAPEVASPPGTMPAASCRLVGPAIRPLELAETLFECGGNYFRVDGSALTRTETARLGGVEGDAASLAGALGRHDASRRAFVHGSLWGAAATHDVPGLVRYDVAAGDWVRAATLPEEEGPLGAVDARESGPDVEVWAYASSGTLHFGTVPADAETVDLGPVATHDAFQAHYGAEWFPSSATVHAIGPGEALLIHDHWRVTHVDAATGAVEPRSTSGSFGRGGSPPFAMGGDLYVYEAERGVMTLDAEGQLHPVEWDGADPIDAALLGEELSWVVTGGALLRCEGGCQRVELPGLSGIRGVAAAGDESLAVTLDDALGTLPIARLQR